MESSAASAFKPKSPQSLWQNVLLACVALACLLVLLAALLLRDVQLREATVLPALKTDTTAGAVQAAEWNSLAWQKNLWPEQQRAAAPKQAPVRRPTAKLIAIVQQGDDVKAAIDAGDGMHFLRVGDSHKRMTLVSIDIDKVEMEFQSQRFYLELP